MTEPTGFTAVGMVGFTDQGTYSASATYVKNDLVHYGGSIWCCLIDDTMGIEPTEGVNWRFWVENSQKGISDIVNVLGAKNLLPYPYVDGNNKSTEGVTFSVDNNGVIHANGTSTTYCSYNLADDRLPLKLNAGKYILSNSVPLPIYIYLGVWYSTISPSSNTNLAVLRLSNVEREFEITEEMAAKIENGEAYLLVRLASDSNQSGVTWDNMALYPMIRPKGIEDATWQPYTKTNKELTAEVTQNSSDIQTLANNVQTLSDDIEDANDRIDEIEAISELNPTLVGSEILVITDSFGQNPDGNVLTGFNKCLSGVNTLVQGGANFSSFATMMSSYTGDKTAIKSVILVGGTNEHDVSLIASHLGDIKTASNDYPNATIFIAFVKSNFVSSTERALVNSLLTEIKKECYNNDFKFLGNFNHCFYPTFANIGSDGVHPTPTGGERIGSAIFNAYANNENKPLISSNVAATDNGLTFTLICDTNGEISVFVTGTTTEKFGAGTFRALDFGTYYYSPSLPTTYRSSAIDLKNGGKLLLGWSGGELKYYYAPENSGVNQLPSGTAVIGQLVALSAIGEKQYAVTNG